MGQTWAKPVLTREQIAQDLLGDYYCTPENPDAPLLRYREVRGPGTEPTSETRVCGSARLSPIPADFLSRMSASQPTRAPCCSTGCECWATSSAAPAAASPALAAGRAQSCRGACRCVGPGLSAAAACRPPPVCCRVLLCRCPSSERLFIAPHRCRCCSTTRARWRLRCSGGGRTSRCAGLPRRTPESLPPAACVHTLTDCTHSHTPPPSNCGCRCPPGHP